MIYEGDFVQGKEWYEKALRINRRENPELLEEASMVFAMVSDFSKAESLLKQALEIRERSARGTAKHGADLMALSLLYLLQGRFDDALAHLEHVQAMDPAILDAEEPGSSVIPRFFVLMIKFIRGDIADMGQLADSFKEIAIGKLSTDSPFQMPAKLILLAIYSKTGRKADFESLFSQLLASWEEAINEGDSETLSFYLGMMTGMAAGIVECVGRASDLAKRFELVSQKSLDFVRGTIGQSTPQFAVSLYSVANANLLLGKNQQAERLFLEAGAITKTTLGESNIFNCMIYLGLGTLYSDVRRYREAEEAFKKALTLAENGMGATSVFAAMAHEGLAKVFHRQKKYDEAIRQYKQVLEISKNIWRAAPGMGVDDLEEIADILQEQKKHSEAEKFLKEALVANEKTWGLNSRELIPSLTKLGSLYFFQEKYKEAETQFRRAVSIAEQNEKSGIENLANSLLCLFEVLSAQEQLDEAKKALQRFKSITQRLPSSQDRDSVVGMLMEFASHHAERQRHAAANRLYQQVIDLYSNEEDDIRPKVAVYVYTIAQYYETRQDYQQAELLFRRALSIDEQALDSDNIEVAIDLEALADLYRITYRYDEGISLYHRSIPIREKVADPIALAISRRRLGFLYLLSHKYSEARSPLSKAAEFWGKMSDTNQLELAECLVNLAVVEYQTTQNYREAETLLLRAIAIEENERDVYYLGDDLRLLGNVYRFQGKYDEAETILRRSRAVIEKAYGANHSTIAKILFNLALVRKARGKLDAAESALQEALAIAGKYPASERSDLIGWLDYYAAALRYMKRDLEAIELEAWAQELRKSQKPNPQSRDESESYGRIERQNQTPLERL